MTPRLTLRTFVCGLVLFLTILASGQAACAGPPAVDNGGSGGGSSPGTDVLDETDRSLALIELSGDTTLAAINGRGTVPLAETEHVLAQAADTSVADHPTANERSIQLVEGTYADGGRLANWDDIASAQQEAAQIASQPHLGQPY